MTIPQDPKPCIDLHCHSTASDGALAPADLVARAAEKGVSHLALTDHDTIAGLPEARKAAAGAGLELIAGVELSCVWRSYTIHLVGLDFDEASPSFLSALARQNENRWQRARIIADKLSRLKVDSLLEQATELAGGDVPGRPHFAQALVDAGVVPKVAHAFKRHLGAGKPGDVKACWPELSEVVQWVRDAEGIAVLAHPRKYRLSATRLRELVSDFCRAGGRGIEVSVSGQSSGDLGFIAELARKESLLASQGSDFHFPGAAWCELGRITKMPEGLEPVWHHFREPVRG
ncbi:PHP domain-containing protein [Marinobacter sp. SS5-14b]|uniref:PHP domain-containing protein n=1 Tax=Marinobacter sp. SS5-14b TaxID=3050456 RepID=UPI0026DF4FAF|nr:PHP domain-containing protein [Marinobacter sp. SS5-14b]